jgi:hypothetical protein
METLAHNPTITADDATERAAILTALDTFIRQRPGLDYGNYGDPVAYRAEVRSIGRDLQDARALLRAVELRPSITAAMLRDALANRLTWDGKRLDYTTGQYWPTEYRAAACRALSVALWAYWRDHCMPETPAGYAVVAWGNRRDWYAGSGYLTRAEAETALKDAGGHGYGHIVELYGYGGRYYSAGDHIRHTARLEMGGPIARRWFN